MGFYTKFSEEDLIASYTNQIDYQGKPDQEIVEEILRRGSLQDFQTKIKTRNFIHDEQNRIIREIHGHYMNKLSKQECLLLIDSSLPQEIIKRLVDIKYDQIHRSIENLKVDSNTLMYSFMGTIVASVISTIIITFLIYKLTFFSVLLFALLIPAYLINYWIIRLFTGKTRDNLAVFIASFIATVLNCVYFALFIS